MTIAPSPQKAGTARILPLAGRIFRQYVARQWVYVVIAVVCMLVTAAASGTIPLLIKYTTQFLFEQKRADMLLPITFAVVGIMVVRAASWFGQKSLLDTVGERVVAACQRDMFDSLMARDLASLNAVHSGQFISGFIYDVSLMRDASAQAISAIALQSVQLVAFAVVMFYQDWQLALIS